MKWVRLAGGMGILGLGVVLAAVAIASGPTDRSSIQAVEPGPGGEVGFATYVLPDYDPCNPAEQATCRDVIVDEDFLASLTVDKGISYPADLGLPECPQPGEYAGLGPDDEIDQKTLDAAPECAVHPREALQHLSMTEEAAAAFMQRYGCGASRLDTCTIDDLKGSEG